jgi:endonuclease/exonuclease/phosphatase (EEP) superfamily protein YafD
MTMPPHSFPHRWILAGAAALMGLATQAACSRGPERTARAPATDQPTLSVMTYNLNYGIAGDEDTLRAIEENPANLVLLQETTPAWEAAIRARLSTRYPYIAFRHCCLAGGLGILSDRDFTDLEYLAPPAGGWFPAWRVRVQGPFGPVQVLNVHLHPQIGESGATLSGVVSGMVKTPAIRQSEIGTYLPHLDADVPTLVAGDFNENENGGAVASLQKRGFRSALPLFSDDYTWHWPTSLGKLSRRFDHIVYGQGLEVLAAHVVKAGNSDHLPVVAVFEPLK